MKQKYDLIKISNYQNNPYYKDNPENFNALVDLVSKNRTQYYYPDFYDIKARQYIEIKGPQFFDSTGKMICPYMYSEWADLKYAQRCDLDEAKHQCMLNANVRIIRTDSICMKQIMTYINQKYTSAYLDSFRNGPGQKS